MKKKWLKKGDMLLVAALLLVAAVLFLCLRFGVSDGAVATVEVDGKTVVTLSLDTNTTYEVVQNGKVTNTVVVQNGKVSMQSADCPDKICVQHRAIAKSGESIVCLPNKVMVTVNGGDEVDGVVQ